MATQLETLAEKFRQESIARNTYTHIPLKGFTIQIIKTHYLMVMKRGKRILVRQSIFKIELVV